MSKEYFEKSRSKTTFVLIGIIIAFVFIAILGSSSKHTDDFLPKYEEWYQQMQSDFEQEKAALRDYQQQLMQQQQQSAYSLSTSLNITNGKLEGFISSSDTTTLENYKKEIEKHAKILDSDDTTFTFQSDDKEHMADIYKLLGNKKVAFKKIWS
ncbi:MAG: hypothetical protein LBH96_02130 [Candidatus Peribacteria bacterium]|jgi:hypothetical protein|nr:hypothetical protein [Candidatus Peribacteria bacterium]